MIFTFFIKGYCQLVGCSWICYLGLLDKLGNNFSLFQLQTKNSFDSEKNLEFWTILLILKPVRYWEENTSKQIEIPYLLTILLSIPYNKLLWFFQLDKLEFMTKSLLEKRHLFHLALKHYWFSLFVKVLAHCCEKQNRRKKNFPQCLT
jgi:hypothetical protein